jgi:halogenation protein CepH
MPRDTELISNDAYDCVIVGGGPAGSTAATVLADHGHSVVVLENSTFPRHQIF